MSPLEAYQMLRDARAAVRAYQQTAQALLVAVSNSKERGEKRGGP